MTIKDSIVNLKKGLRTTLTNVPALIDTLIRGLDGVAEAAEEENTYSTTEHVVGKWIDGSDIYEKTYANSEGWTITGNNITTLDVIDISNVKDMISFNCNDGVSNWAYLANTISGDGKLVVINIRASNVLAKNITLRYTKTSASRAPENDTKNGDEEKNDER